MDSRIPSSKVVRARRPALNAALLVAGGILLAGSIDLPLLLLVLGLAVLLVADVLALLLRRSDGILVQTAFLLTLLTAGALRYEIATTVFPRSHIVNFPYFGQSVVLRGRVVEEPTLSAGRARIAIAVSTVEYGMGPTSTCGKVLLTFGEEVPAPDYGTVSPSRGTSGVRPPREIRERSTTGRIFSVGGSSG